MKTETKIVIQKILSEVLSIHSLASLNVFKSKGFLSETTYFMMDGVQRLLSSKDFDPHGKLIAQEKYAQEGYHWELDDLITHKFEYSQPNIITEVLHKGDQYYGTIIREFDEHLNLLKENGHNEDYEEDYTKFFTYNPAGQIQKISIGSPPKYTYQDIHFTWENAFLEMIEVITYLPENRFYKEYYFITYHSDAIKVNLERRGFVSEMAFKFTNNILSEWTYLIRRIGKVPNEEKRIMYYDPLAAKRTILKASYRDRKFISAAKTVLWELLLTEEILENKSKTRVIEFKNNHDELDENQLNKILKFQHRKNEK